MYIAFTSPKIIVGYSQTKEYPISLIKYQAMASNQPGYANADAFHYPDISNNYLPTHSIY